MVQYVPHGRTTTERHETASETREEQDLQTISYCSTNFICSEETCAPVYN